MIVRLDDGPLAGSEYEISDAGGGVLERTVPELRNDETYVLARYERTDKTAGTVRRQETREGTKFKPAVATLYRFVGLRHVPRSDPRTRRESYDPDGQTRLLV